MPDEAFRIRYTGGDRPDQPAAAPAPAPEQLHRVDEAGEVLKLSGSAVRRLIQAGNLAAVRVGGSIRVPDAALRRFMATLPPVVPVAG